MNIYALSNNYFSLCTLRSLWCKRLYEIIGLIKELDGTGTSSTH